MFHVFYTCAEMSDSTIRGLARGLNAPVRRGKKMFSKLLRLTRGYSSLKFRKLKRTTHPNVGWERVFLSLSRRSFCRSAGTHGDFHGFATTGRIETSLLSEQRGTPSAGRPRDRDDVSLRVGDDGQDDDNDRRSWNEITALRALKVDLRTASAGRYADNFATR